MEMVTCTDTLTPLLRMKRSMPMAMGKGSTITTLTTMSMSVSMKKGTDMTYKDMTAPPNHKGLIPLLICDQVLSHDLP
jgi:hypothetical protein